MMLKEYKEPSNKEQALLNERMARLLEQYGQQQSLVIPG
jgi:hypothetical protein